MIVSRRRACRSRMCAAYAGNFSLARVGVLREVVELHDGRHQRGAARDHRVDQVGGQAGAVLDAVDAGLDQHRQHGLAEAVRGHPGAVLVRGRDRLGERLRRERRREVARPRGRSSPPPASPSRRRAAPPARRTPRGPPARPRGRSCGCSAGCGRCAARRGSAGAGPRGRGSRRCRPASRSRAAAARPRRGRRPPAPRWSPRRRRRARRARRGSARRPGRARSSRWPPVSAPATCS